MSGRAKALDEAMVQKGMDALYPAIPEEGEGLREAARAITGIRESVADPDFEWIVSFGAGERVPKKYAEAKLRPIPATTQTRRESVANPESPAVAGRDDG